MSLEIGGWNFIERPELTDAQMFELWVTFGGGWTLEEYTEAYRRCAP